jgi:hypothetical protein
VGEEVILVRCEVGSPSALWTAREIDRKQEIAQRLHPRA